MSIVYSENEAILSDDIRVQEVDGLSEWLLANPNASINLRQCRHLHLAAVQALICAARHVSEWPEDPDLDYWVRPVLVRQEDEP